MSGFCSYFVMVAISFRLSMGAENSSIIAEAAVEALPVALSTIAAFIISRVMLEKEKMVKSPITARGIKLVKNTTGVSLNFFRATEMPPQILELFGNFRPLDSSII